MADEPRVLITDDDEGSRVILARILARKGFVVDTAETGRQALDKARDTAYDIALLDIKLPDVAGMELIAPLKDMQPDLAVIIVTAFASVKSATRALNMGASGFVTKPIEFDEVLTMIGETLDKQRLTRQIRQGQKALRESEELHRAVTETLPDAVTVTDLEGCITYASQRAVALLGFANADEMVGRGILEMISDEEQEEARVCLQRTREEEIVRDVEFSLVGKDGRGFPGELSLALMRHPSGEPMGFVAITRDISVRKRAEQALRRSLG